MGINLGQTPTKAVYLGQTAVKSVFFGSQRVWGGEEPAPTAEPLCFTLESSTFTETISLNKNGSPDSISIEYSTDGSTWSDYTWDGSTGLAIQLASNGDKVYFRAKNENPTIGSNSGNYYQFFATGWNGVVRISGNVQTLLKADGTRTDAPAWCYYYLFAGRPDWKSAPELPATTLGQYCYASMFWVSTGLTAAPALPATTLADYCYQNMFYGCSSLTTAPALPATTLNQYCYRNMFQNCTSLTAAPELPAQTITAGVYNGMFRGCTSLTDAPELPAATLVYDCYTDMFNGCSSLSSVEVAFTVWTSASTTPDWLKNVAASGTFTCPAELPDTRGASNIPTGWTVVKPVSNAFRLTAKSAGSTARITSSSVLVTPHLEYSTDEGVSWSPYTVGDTLTAANVGDSILMRASEPNTGYINGRYPTIVTTGDFAASGRFDSMLRPDYESTSATYARSYTRLFYQSQGVSEVSAQGLYEYVQPDGDQGPFNQAFAETTALTSITFSDLKVANGSPQAGNANGMFTNGFSKSQNLLVVNFPELESISCQAFWAAFEKCPNLSAVLMPKLKNLDGYGFYSGAFDQCPSMRVLDFSGFESVPPITNTNPFSTLPSSCSVIIPDSLYDTWTIAAGWSSLPCQYVKKSDFYRTAEPLKFTALSEYSSVALGHDGSDSQYAAPSLEYSTDGQSWSEYQLGHLVILQSPGDYVMMRATASNRFSTARTNYFKFSGAGQLRASGDATTLLEPDGSVLSAPDTVFHKLFQGCAMLKDVADLKFPSLSVGQESYNNMFNGAGISAAPELPATTLGANCYGNMFQACGSLVKASDLSAGELVTYCYQGMYQNCSSLKDGPRIMATSATGSNHMDYMFYQTSNLSSVEVNFTSWPGTMQWMQNVQTSSGEFRCPAALPDVRGISNIPNGWTVVKPAATKSLKFTALQPNSTVSLSSLNGYQGTYLSSGDGVAFSPYAMNGVVSLAGVGDSVWFKAGADNPLPTGDDNSSNFVGYRFYGTGRLSAYGWLESLMVADEADFPSANGEFAYRSSFRYLSALESIVVRGEFLSASQASGSNGSRQFANTFRQCSALTSIEFQDVLSASGDYSWNDAGAGMFCNAACTDSSLQVARFPKLEYAKSDAFWAAFENDPALLSVEFPSLKKAEPDAFFAIFNGMTGVPKVVLLSAMESVPQMAHSTEGWGNLNSQTSVVIPDALYDEWTTATNWSSLAVTYVKASEFVTA